MAQRSITASNNLASGFSIQLAPFFFLPCEMLHTNHTSSAACRRILGQLAQKSDSEEAHKVIPSYFTDIDSIE